MPRVSKEIRYPPLRDPRTYLITRCEVVNKGEGGNVSCTGGGYLVNFVSLHLEAGEGKGFEFNIVIYGYQYD